MKEVYLLALLLFLFILYIIYKKYYSSKKDLREDFDNNLIKINNKNYELDDYSVNNILNELNNDINI
jgi:type II secretory pathway component PulF